MKTNYHISIVNNDIHKNECLSEVINNLEKLEVFADDIFNRINKKVIFYIIICIILSNICNFYISIIKSNKNHLMIFY